MPAMETPCPFPPFPYATLDLVTFSVKILYHKLVNISKYFPEFCELFQQIIDPKKGVVESPIYSQSVRSTGDNLELVIGI